MVFTRPRGTNCVPYGTCYTGAFREALLRLVAPVGSTKHDLGLGAEQDGDSDGDDDGDDTSDCSGDGDGAAGDSDEDECEDDHDLELTISGEALHALLAEGVARIPAPGPCGEARRSAWYEGVADSLLQELVFDDEDDEGAR